jgi:hypothetical protein
MMDLQKEDHAHFDHLWNVKVNTPTVRSAEQKEAKR